MKTILTAIAFFCCSFSFAGISPSADAEYCPLQELYFDIDYSGNKDFYTIQEFGNLNAMLVSTDGNRMSRLIFVCLALR